MEVEASSLLGQLGAAASPPTGPTEHAQEVPGSGGNDSDEHLVDRYCAGDVEAFGILYDRFRAPLRRFVARLSADQDEADEVLQEVWLAVIRGKRSYRGAAKFKTFLFSIAHRRLSDHWRRRGRRSRAFAEADTPSDPDQIADEAAIPEDWTQHAKLREALLAAIDQLPPPQRAVFLLKAEADLSLEEIAVATGASIEATKSRMRYALARLRAKLADWR
jgi:RNA polymerase sigma-70 factor, ECF subfamily